MPTRFVLTILLTCVHSAVPTAMLNRVDDEGQYSSEQTAGCLRTIERDTKIAHRYRSRGDRCEGFYAQPFGSSAFHLVGFGPRRDVPLDAIPGPMEVSWTTPRNDIDTIYLRSEPRRRSTFYQMDTRVARGDVFVWRRELAVAAGVGRQAFDVLCWIQMPLAGRRRSVLIPCQLGRHPTVEVSEVRVRTGQPVRQVAYSISRIERGRATPIRRQLLGGPFNTGYLLTLAPEEFRGGGMYKLTLTAILIDQVEESQEYWLLSSAPHSKPSVLR